MNLENDYVDNIIEINKNLRNQLELLYKLLRTKLKLDNLNENTKLENIINELEILKTSFSFNMQKQSNIIKNIKKLEIALQNQEKFNFYIQETENKISNLDNLVDKYSKENMLWQEKVKKIDHSNEDFKIQLENRISEIDSLKKHNSELNKNIEEEKAKNKNLVSLIKELEKKKSSAKIESECLNLKEQVEYLSKRIKEIEGKFKTKLEKKDMIIQKLDQNLCEYEAKLNSYRK